MRPSWPAQRVDSVDCGFRANEGNCLHCSTLQTVRRVNPEITANHPVIVLLALGDETDCEFLFVRIHKLLSNRRWTTLRPSRTIDGRPFWKDEFSTCGLRLLLSQDCACSAVDCPSAQLDWRVQALLQIILTDRGNLNHSLKTLAENFKTSGSHLGCLFRNQLGICFRRCLRTARMAEVAGRLCSSAESANSIAPTLGYNDVTNFRRDFRLFFKTTPEKFRRHYKDRGYHCAKLCPLF